jgi:hypothetical protein
MNGFIEIVDRRYNTSFFALEGNRVRQYACGCVTMGKKLAVRGFGHADLESH